MGRKKKQKKLEPHADEAEIIKKKLPEVTTAPPIRHWLDTGVPALNAVLGSEEKGLPYGRLYELSGKKSQGKSLLTHDIAAMAQKDGAHVAWLSLEEPFDPEWAYRRGLDPAQVKVWETRAVTEKKRPRLVTAEEMFDELEAWIISTAIAHKGCKMFVGVDSVTALLAEKEETAGMVDQNMATRLALAQFMGPMCRRFAALAMTYNVMMFFVNQIRMRPGVMFGNPETTTGGMALGHYVASSVYVYRLGGGELKNGKERIGFRGVLRNEKNKIGGGSVEHRYAGFVYRFRYKTKYLSFDSILRQKAQEKRGSLESPTE